MTSRMAVTSHNPEETQAVGRALGRLVRSGDVILLSGALGSGKTCLTQGIAWGMGITEYAHSPTFVLVHQYRGPLTLYHVDLYRLDDPREVVDMGIDEYLEAGGVCVVEWAEKAMQVFPPEHLLVLLEEVSEEERRLAFRGAGRRHQELVAALRRSLKPPRRT